MEERKRWRAFSLLVHSLNGHKAKDRSLGLLPGLPRGYRFGPFSTAFSGALARSQVKHPGLELAHI